MSQRYDSRATIFSSECRLYQSSNANELDAGRRESENPMRRCLTWWDLLWLSFGSVVGSGVFVNTGQEARTGAGPAIVTSYAISGISALLSVLCYAEFGVEIPVAGGSFSYLRVELGDFIAFIAAGNILLEAIVGAAGLGRSWSSYLASLVKNDSDFFRIKVDSFAKGFDLLDPVAVAVLLVANGIAMSGTKRTSCLNLITSIVTVCVIGFIVVVGFTHSKSSNLIQKGKASDESPSNPTDILTSSSAENPKEPKKRGTSKQPFKPVHIRVIKKQSQQTSSTTAAPAKTEEKKSDGVANAGLASSFQSYGSDEDED